MIPIIDFERRSLGGPVMKATKFDLGFSRKLREVVEKYQVEYDPDVVIADDATADAVFQAAVELLACVGLYQLDTQRVIEFGEAELLEIAREQRENPPVATFGSGDDQITVEYRTSDEERPPILAAGPAGAIEQEWFHAYIRTFVEEPSNRALGIAGGITAVDGVVPKVGSVSEMHCAQWECEQLLKILDDAGRPGMHLGLLCTASTPAATMACIGPGLRTPSNTQIGVHVIPEQKIDWSRLVLAKFCEDRGITPWTSCMSVMGGLCRHGPDVAVALVANLLAQLAYAHGSMASLFTNRLDGTWGDLEVKWAFSAACRASERNIRVPIAGCAIGNAEAMRTEASILQGAATAVIMTASGFSYAWIAGGSGIDARLIGEVMTAVAGMPREQAGDLARSLLAEADRVIAAGKQPIEFLDAIDIKTAKAKPKFAAECENALETLARLGALSG